MVRTSRLLNFYCIECGKEFVNNQELYEHNCSKKEFKKELRKASSETGGLFVSPGEKDAPLHA